MYDQEKGTNRSGSAPVEQKQPPVRPAAKPLNVAADDAPIVKQAAGMDRQQLSEQVHQHQARGAQPGFGKSELDGVVAASPAQPPTEERLYEPDEDGTVPDLPDEEAVYPAPETEGLPEGAVPLARLSEPEGR